jgi:hypothetical protein
MKSFSSTIKQFLSSKWREAILSGLSVTIGIIIGPVLEKLFPSLFSDPNLIYVTFAVIVLVFVGTSPLILSMWKDTNQQIESVNIYTKIIADSLGQKARLIPAKEGYKETQEWLKNAEKEILVLSNYVFDWENGKPVFDLEILESPERKVLYSLMQEKVTEKQANNEQFKFCRIVQIPKNHSIDEILPHDEYYRESSKFIASISKLNPELASLRTAEPLFTNTFTIVDRKHLYIEFNAFTPDVTKAFTPFVLLIDDPKSEIVSSMLSLHQRIEAVSTLVREVK